MSWQPGEPLPDDMFIWPNWALDMLLERVEIMRVEGVEDAERKAEMDTRRQAGWWK